MKYELLIKTDDVDELRYFVESILRHEKPTEGITRADDRSKSSLEAVEGFAKGNIQNVVKELTEKSIIKKTHELDEVIKRPVLKSATHGFTQEIKDIIYPLFEKGIESSAIVKILKDHYDISVTPIQIRNSKVAYAKHKNKSKKSEPKTISEDDIVDIIMRSHSRGALAYEISQMLSNKGIKKTPGEVDSIIQKQEAGVFA